ncbi:MAG: hypothetical protein ACHQ7M_16365, partial [Chloroflexota bacterium]
QMIQRLRAAGNADNLDAFTNTQLAQTMAGAYTKGQEQSQMQQAQASQQQQARNTTLDRLLPILQADPAAMPVVNAIFAQMGLPPMQTPAGVNPNGISMSDWTAMSPAAQQLLLSSFPGGPNGAAAKDFLAALQASAPTQQKQAQGVNVSYAPLAA